MSAQGSEQQVVFSSNPPSSSGYNRGGQRPPMNNYTRRGGNYGSGGAGEWHGAPFAGVSSRGGSGPPGASLRPVNWEHEHLENFEKNFYVEHADVKKRSREEVAQMMKERDITVSGATPIPRPITSFSEACFPSYVTNAIKQAGFEAPYPIQTMGWPVALMGRDMVGIAQTGSGKTLAYLLPAILHINAQPPLRPGDGPVALVLAPTRELAMQIHKETVKFGRSSSLNVCCIYGGVSRQGQIAELRRSCHALIGTPGRLIDFLETGVTNLKRVTYLVLDEADRMLDMGFEPQMRSIVGQIRPDRQTLMWSATWPHDVQSLARDFCREDPVKLVVGNHELQANENIQQVIEVVGVKEKGERFIAWLEEHCRHGEKVLVFCETKRDCEVVCRELQSRWNFHAATIHGDKEQRDRDRVLQDFRVGRCNLLIATDVASRGLDVKNIDFVVNYDVPKTVEDYIHRIGRTGRAGSKGIALTFFPKVSSYGKQNAPVIRMARDLARVIRDVGQTPPPELEEYIGQTQCGGGGGFSNSGYRGSQYNNSRNGGGGCYNGGSRGGGYRSARGRGNGNVYNQQNYGNTSNNNGYSDNNSPGDGYDKNQNGGYRRGGEYRN